GSQLWCDNCCALNRQVDAPIPLIVPVTLDVDPERRHPLSDLLWSYQQPRASPLDVLRVGALLTRFLNQHHSCVQRAAGASWNTLAVTPLRDGRVVHPMRQGLARCGSYRSRTWPDMERDVLRHVRDV